MSLLDKLPKISLPNIPFLNGGAQKGDYYFALNITKNFVEAAVWGIEGNRLHIINTCKAQYKDGNGLANAGNYALDESLGDFPIEPTKILFGVPESWLQDDNLKPEHLKILKALSKDLDVAPMAFVSSAHAISHFMQQQHGVPLTAVLVEVADPLVVSVVKAGKIIGSRSHKRTANLPEDIEKALLTFTDIEVLPTKIIVYGDDELDKFKDELASYSWMSQLPFLHLPKIESLDKELPIQAICLAGGSELHPDIHYKAPAHHKEEEKKQHLSRPLDEETGFIEGDIQEPRHRGRVEENEEEMLEEGGQKKLAAMVPAHKPDLTPEHPSHHQETALDRVKETVMAPFEQHPGKHKRFGFPIIPVAAVVVILLLLSLGYVFLTKANVEVFIDMQNLSNSATITADPGITSVDEANKKIPGRIVDTVQSGTDKAAATGKKQIGDPAKGNVVLYNKTDSPKNFASGTVLTGPNNLKFKLDTSVQVASQSAVDGGISFGKSTGSVTAVEIGPDGNLPAGQELSIDGQSSSSYSAKSDSAFAGGISKDVTVVTSDDQKRLLAKLTSDLRQKAQQDLQSKATEDLKILTEALNEQIKSQSFSKKPGDQASDFNLTLTVNYRGTAYHDKDLKQIISSLVSVEMPKNFEIDQSQSQTQAAVTKLEKDGKLIFTASYIAKLIPKVDMEKLKKDLAFKSVDQATEKVKEIGNVIGSNMKITPNIPIKPLQRLPVLPQNISVEITTK
jgi:hypothetical protein